MKVIAHIDMDQFFVACEVKKKPHLAGKAVIVGALPNQNRGVVCTASYQAREFGVKSAMPISTAYKLCPSGVYIKPDHEYYRKQSKLIMNILSAISDEMYQLSCDEAYLNITNFVKVFDSKQLAGEFICKLIKKKTKMDCSIGIANSKVVAKIASDYKKPKGITVVEDSKDFLNLMSISKIPGVGKVSLVKMNDLGLYRIGDILVKGKFFMIEHFGIYGSKLFDIANGTYRTAKLKREIKKSSISKEFTFSDDQSSFDLIKSKFIYICSKLYVSLKSNFFRTVSIKIRYNDFETITRDFSYNFSTNKLDFIYEAIDRLFSQFSNLEKPVRLVGVKLSNLTKTSEKQNQLYNYL